MDALLQILVPRFTNVEQLIIKQPVYEWDGIEYPQGPKIVSWKDVLLSFDEKSKYREKFLPDKYFDENWIWLKVSDETLDKYEEEVNNYIEPEPDENLETFLELFLKDLDKWVISFFPQYDQIDNIYQLDLESCLIKLRKNLNKNFSKEGFIAYK